MTQLEQASLGMIDALEALEAWEDDFGSRSITEAVWAARDDLRAALSEAAHSQPGSGA